MSAIEIMAASLDQDLQARGIFSLTRRDCEVMVRRMIERTAEIEAITRPYRTAAATLLTSNTDTADLPIIDSDQ
jgi:hypothetical protein